MINIYDLRDMVVRPCLKRLRAWSHAAERLVIGTALAESVIYGETRLRQVRGPALGIYQMEPETHFDIWQNYLDYRTELARLVLNNRRSGREEYLANDLDYATALCRIHYLRVPEPLPDADDIGGLAAYWKEHYNTHLGSGTIDGFCKKAERVMEL